MRLEGEQGMRNWYAQKHDGVATSNVTPHGPPGAPSEEIREDNQNAGTDSKKRKTTENGSSSTSYQHGADVRQGFLREEYEEVSVKKRMRLEGEQGMRNWYAQKHDGVAMGKPEMVEFYETETVESAIRAIQESTECGILVWRKRSSVPPHVVENSEVRQQILWGYSISNSF
ncbi:hypothetical protein Bca52824_017521 [Brassica carinata]|uniref:Uncharacterized protein n=1 Tax=Brassica carinata TaxID=52824 RepID=A0A8X7VMR3_BRACI|nr:hypothetical protein Bca52824_017521 [Brassica carinata]